MYAAEGEQFLIMQAAAASAAEISWPDGSGAAILKEWQAGPAAALADKQLQSNGSTTARRLSADQSHEDFEFNKVVGMMQATTVGDKEGEYKHHELEMPSADELFYKGQLLPLAAQYKSNMQKAWANQQYLHLHDDSATSKSSNYTAINASATASPPTHHNISAADGDPFEPFPSQLVSREQDVRFSSSCRMELGQKHQLDSILSPSPSSLFDLRCSSFRSHSSKYSSYYCHYYANYGSSSTCSTNGDSSITGGESSSSSCSRDSNGSSQDSAGAAAAAPAAACSTSYPSSDFPNIMSRDHHLCCSCSCCHAPLHGPKRKPLGFLQSWRLFLLHGLKRGTSSALDHHHQTHHNPISCKAHNTVHVGGLQQRAAAAANSSFSAELSMYKNPNQELSASSTCACKSQDSRRGTCIRNTNYDCCKPRSTGLMDKQSGVKLKDQGSSVHKQSVPSSEVKKASCAINSGTSNSCSSKSSKWHRRIKPNLSTIKARLVGANQLEKAKEDQEEEESGWSTTKRRVTRKQPSLDRKFSQTSLCDGAGVKGSLSNLQPSFRFHAGGSAATSSSCPASVRSSPNHSGLLSPPPPTSSISSMTSMQELHSAVQGAIAHCKQSNSAPFLEAPPPPPA
ncbi:hypothetical protein L7F22_063698 [Adiantum nelumboides]|nr:hypothetical protein [Adiantum nelumboides]